MRFFVGLALAVLTTSAALALDMPARKPGLWQLSIKFEGRNLPPQVVKHCIDAATDREMSTIGSSTQKQMCTKQDVQKIGDTIVVDSTCKFETMTSTSH